MQDCTTCANYRPAQVAQRTVSTRVERYMGYIEDSISGLTMSEKIADLKTALSYVFQHLDNHNQDGLLSEEARDQDLRTQQRAREAASGKHPF